MKKSNKLLFYTCVNEKYYEFGILYPIFVMETNPDALVEIGVDSLRKFTNKYKHLINFYDEKFQGRVIFTEKKFYERIFFKKKSIMPNSIRFIRKPKLKADYIYIGDGDILILENVLSKHLKNIKDNNLDFSNIVRKGTKRLSGLHFIEYDKMYPLPKVKLKDTKQDEKLLYKMMNNKGYNLPVKSEYRPLHGLHISFFSRPPFNTKTTNDDFVNIPGWFMNTTNIENYANKNYFKKYFTVRNSILLKEFFNNIHAKDIELRRIIQIIDSIVYFAKSTDCKSIPTL